MKTLFNFIVFVILFSSTAGLVHSQANLQGAGFVQFANSNSNFNYGVQEIKDNSKKVKGSSLLFDKYVKGTFKLKQGNNSEEYFLNYDLFTNTVNVSGKDVVFTVPVGYLDSMIITNNGVTQTFKLFENEKQESKLMEILVDGEYALLKDVSAKLIKPTYKASIDAGDKFYKIRKKDVFYFLDNGNLIKLPNKSKHFKKIKALKAHVKKAEKKSKIDFKNENEVIAFFKGINQTIK